MSRRILDAMVKATIKRIGDEPVPRETIVVLTPELKALSQHYRSAQRTIAQVYKILKRRGLSIHEGGKISVDWAARNDEQRRFRLGQEKRRTTVRELRDQALLDLLGLDPLPAKRYLLTLKKRLEAI